MRIGPAAEDAGPARLANGLTSEGFDAVKGFFVLLIAVGHNTHLSAAWPPLSDTLYNFHVFAFLLLPFLMPSRPWSARFVGDRAVRYLVPYAAFYLMAATLFLASGAAGTGPAAQVGEALLGLVLGTAEPIKRGCGFLLYWFLPALWSVVLLRGALQNASAPARLAVLAASCVFFVSAGALSRESKEWMWMGSGIALYVYPLGLLAAWIWSLRSRVPASVVGAVAALIGVALSALALHLDSGVRLSRLVVPDAREPLRLLLHAALPVAATVAGVAAAPILARLPGMVALGRHSLIVYLSHSLVFQALLRVLPEPAGSPGALLAAGMGVLVVTLAGAMLVALVIQRIGALRRAITPRTVSEWPLTRLAG